MCDCDCNDYCTICDLEKKIEKLQSCMNNKFVVSTSSIIPFNNVSIIPPEWISPIIFTGVISLVFYTKPFYLNLKQNLSCFTPKLTNDLIINQVDGIVQVIVNNLIISTGPTIAGTYELIMPIPLPPLMNPRQNVLVELYSPNNDPFNFQVQSGVIPFTYAIVNINSDGIVTLKVTFIDTVGGNFIASNKRVILTFTT